MDPNVTLADARQATEVARTVESLASRNLHRERALELYVALDDWLSRGGTKPTAWSSATVASDHDLTSSEIHAIQRLLQPAGTWTEGDPCALCHEPEEPEDPIAHFVAPDGSTYVMAHGQCGLDAGLRLA